MTSIPDSGQAHETCGGVKLVQWDPNPPPTNGQRKIKENTSSITDEPQNQTELHPT